MEANIMVKLDREKLYPWLAVLRAKYMGSGRVRMLIQHFGSLEKAFRASRGELMRVPGFNEKIVDSIREAAQGKYDQWVERELKWIAREGVSILLYTDDDFPDSLRHIPSPPAILYVKGNVLPSDVISIAIVGSRRASGSGCRIANQIASELCEAGLTVISGLAWGIDAAAHKGALKTRHGRTIGVLGNGLGFVYPKEFKILYEQVKNRGALVTELFSDVAPDARNFPPRNRIISGLTLGTLIVEAPAKSGALITAEYALEQGKEIYALPGALGQDTGEGNNRLIQESRAKLVTGAEDILKDLQDKIIYYKNELAGNIKKIEPYHTIEPSKPVVVQTKPEPEPNPATGNKSVLDEQTAGESTLPEERKLDFTPDETAVLKYLTDQPKHIDVICREMNWQIARVSSALGLLELRGIIEREAGMRFRII
jgi:DNA processing protein